MPILLTNCFLLDLDPLRVERADLRVEGNRITARGPSLPRQPGDETLDCNGSVVLPGLVNGHTHLYSALAPGMPPPPATPTNFHEVLQLVWWRLDRALDAESVHFSALVGALDALRCGTTTLIDHHASPNAISNSLDHVECGIASVGLRGVLCYEVTDRNGPEGRELGIEENRRFLRNCATRRRNNRFAGLVGAHAAFTLADDALKDLTTLADQFNVGVHIHVAEDPCDDAICRKEYGAPLMDRLNRAGLLTPRSVFGHGTHLDFQGTSQLLATQVTVAHNPSSNMNNAVGYAPVVRLPGRVMLGTDGIGADMPAEARTAWFKSRDGHANIAPRDVAAMLALSARRASQSLGVTLGKLEPGAAADVVVTDYLPHTPLHTDNALGHLLFALSSRHVRHVLIDGQWKLRDRAALTCNEPEVRQESQRVAAEMWKRMESIAP